MAFSTTLLSSSLSSNTTSSSSSSSTSESSILPLPSASTLPPFNTEQFTLDILKFDPTIPETIPFLSSESSTTRPKIAPDFRFSWLSSTIPKEKYLFDDIPIPDVYKTRLDTFQKRGKTFRDIREIADDPEAKHYLTARTEIAANAAPWGIFKMMLYISACDLGLKNIPKQTITLEEQITENGLGGKLSYS